MSADNYPARYEAGESLLVLSLDAHCDPKTMRALLVRAGVTIRPKGGTRRTNLHPRTQPSRSELDPSARIARSNVSRMYR